MNHQDYDRIEQAIRYLERARPGQPPLSDVARHVGLSESHFQRLFSRWAGVSPKRFLQFLTVEHAKRLLQERETVLNTTYDVGLSSQGRLHDLFVSVEAVTPGEYKSLGHGLEVRYGFQPSPFGECLLATTDRGICHLAFVAQGEHDQALAQLRKSWEHGTLREAAGQTKRIARQVFRPLETEQPQPIHVFLKGTNFQLKVWNALLRIPMGRAVSYSDVARTVCSAAASRAVGAAIGRNTLAYLIPCHRVLRQTGEFGEYRWGATRKKAILAWEAARSQMKAAPEGDPALDAVAVGV